jgi:photosystem II stability/assembly factor-like uncharacterized protein
MSMQKSLKQLFITLALVSFSILSFNSSAENSTKLQWRNSQLPTAPSLRGSAIIANSLWVSGTNNSVFVSQDGGKSWQDKSVKSSLKTDFRDIALFDNKTAIVMGVGSGKQSVLYKTIDAGNTWQLLYQNTDKQGFFDAIAFWNADHGLLMGDPVDGYYLIKKTIDGGKTWRRISKTKLPAIANNEAAFAASGNTLIIGKNQQAWLTTGGFAASVYCSSDQGESWQRFTVPLYKETATAGGYGLALNKKQQLFVVGGDYQQREKTYANMATLLNNRWQTVNNTQQGLRTAMSCQQATCIATGKTSNDISFDHGKTWQPLTNLTMAKNQQGFYTLAADNGLFLAAGEKGKIGVLSIKKRY